MKITLKDFFNSEKPLVIHCKTEEEAQKLCEAFDKMGKKWYDGESYLEDNRWGEYKEDICYSNFDMCFSIKYVRDDIIYDFEDVILDDKMQAIILSDDELKIINDALKLYVEQVTKGLVLYNTKEIKNISKNLGKLQKKLEEK